MKRLLVTNTCLVAVAFAAGLIATSQAAEPRSRDSQIEIQPAPKQGDRAALERREQAELREREQRRVEAVRQDQETHAARIAQLERQLREITERLERTESRLAKYENAFRKKRSIVR